MDEDQMPQELALVEDFVNTRDEPGEHSEQLGSPADLQRWLVERALTRPGDALGARDLERALALREALRALLTANHDETEAPADALETLSAEAATLPLHLDFSTTGPRLRPDATGFDRAVGLLLVAVYSAMRDGTWERLKVCSSDTCVAAFYDASRNRAGRFCSHGCRNVTKVRRFRARQKGAADG